MGLDVRKLSLGLANNKGADQSFEYPPTAYVLDEKWKLIIFKYTFLSGVLSQWLPAAKKRTFASALECSN